MKTLWLTLDDLAGGETDPVLEDGKKVPRLVVAGAVGTIRVDRPVRFSVSLSPALLLRVKALARARGWSRSRVMADLVRAGLDAHDREHEHFLAVAGRLARATEEAELQMLQEELARLTFGS